MKLILNCKELIDLLKMLERTRDALDEAGDIDSGIKADFISRDIIKGSKHIDRHVEIELSKDNSIELIKTTMLQTARIEQVYFDLRDAKSNGCCFGKPRAEIEEYDKKINKAWDAVLLAREVERLVSSSILDNVKRQEELQDV